MTALLHALANLARLRWLGATFCALAMLCVTTHASALAGATAHARIDVRASSDITTTASELAQTKTRVWGFEQNSPLHVCALRSASAETHLEIPPTLPETASASSYAARGGKTVESFLPAAAKRVEAAKLKYGGEGVLGMAKKADIKQVRDAARQAGLSDDHVELLHEAMGELKGADGKVPSFKEILDLAKQIRKDYPNK